MGHPSIEEIVAGRCDEHLARCDSCRRLALMADATGPAPPPGEPAGPTDDLDRLPPVDAANYTDWAPLADARGGMGRISRARDRRLGREVAIKQLADHLDARERSVLVHRFEREARLTARLQHPSIVGIYEAGRFGDGEPFYAMPLLRGAPLSKEIERRKTLAERLALLPHVIAMAEAVAYAHDEGIVHRDLKPDNVLVGGFGETMVIDWGLAKDLADASSEPEGVYRASPPKDGLTQLGVGTAHYMAPEQARGEEPDVRADVYALGATLYHALAGLPPYAEQGSTRVRLAKFDERPPRPLALAVPECPRELCDIVDRAMALEREARFASARELAEELRRFQTGQLVTSRRYTFGELVRHFARRHRTALRVSAIAAALVLAIVAVAFVRIARERDRAERAHDRAERELRRAQGIVASRSAADPARRLDSVLLGVRAVAPDLRGGRVAAEAWQGLVDALAAGPPLVALEHEGVIKHVARSGDRLLGVDDARALVVWDRRSGRRLARWPSALPQPERPVPSPDGARAVVCGFDPIGEVFELATGAHRTFEAKANLEGCGFLPDGRLITAADEVVVRDPDSLAVVERFALPRPAQGLAIAADGSVAVTALGGTLWLWRPGSAPATIATGLPLGASSAFAPDGRTLYQNGADQVVRAFDVARPEAPPVTLYQDTRTHLAGLVPSRDGRLVGVGAFDVDGQRRTLVVPPAGGAAARELAGSILTWAASPGEALVDRGGPLALVDAERGGDVLVLAAHGTETAALLDGDRLVSASRDGAAYLWDLSGGTDGGLLLGHTGEIVTLAARGGALASAGEDGALRVWDARTGALRATATSERELTAAAWLGDAIVAGDLGGAVWIVDGAGRERARALAVAPIAALAVAPAGDRVAIGAQDGTLELRDAALAHPLALRAPGAGAITAIAWSPDGRRVASAHADGSTRLWDATTGAAVAAVPDPEPVDEPGDHEGHVALAFAGDGGTLLAVRPAGQTRVLDARDLSTRATLDGRMLALGPDGSIAAAVGDGGVLLHLPAGEPVRLTGSREAALVAAFDGAGRLAVARADGTVELWDLRDRAAPVRTITIAAPGLGAATALLFDGERLVIGHASGALRVYPTTAAAAVARACSIAHRFGRDGEVAAYCKGSSASDRR